MSCTRSKYICFWGMTKVKAYILITEFKLICIFFGWHAHATQSIPIAIWHTGENFTFIRAHADRTVTGYLNKQWYHTGARVKDTLVCAAQEKRKKVIDKGDICK